MSPPGAPPNGIVRGRDERGPACRSVRASGALALGAGLLAGVVVAYRESGEHLFERATRALDVTGGVLVPLSLLFASGVAFLAMVLGFAAICALWRLARWRLSSR